MASVQVEQTGTAPDGWDFLVRVGEGGSHTEHRVTVARRDYERLTRAAVTPEVLVEKTFEFLLDRERKESILRQFELSVVTRYFPEFETELKRALATS
jgi:hypothetical protein